MTALEVRRPKFDFTDDVPWEWNPANPQFSFFMNATSIIAICFEQFIVAAVQEAKPLITDPDSGRRGDGFPAAGGAALQHPPQARRGPDQALPRPAAHVRRRNGQLRRPHEHHSAEVPVGVHRRPGGDLHAEFQADARQRGRRCFAPATTGWRLC